MRDKPLSKTYRDREVTQIMGAIRAGDSCTIIGIGSAGKSNLLRFLQRPDILQDRLGADWEQYLIVYVDGNKLIEHSLWGLIELMLYQMVAALSESAGEIASGGTAGSDFAGDRITGAGAASPGVTGALEELYDKAIQPETHAFAIRYLEHAINLIRKRLDLHLVFLLDEFDALYAKLAARGFAALRALRDDHKYRLSYLVAVRQDWRRSREDWAAVEAFEELVSPLTVWLGPYSEADAREMLGRLAARDGSTLDESSQRTILTQTGGHPGLVRAAYRTALESPPHLIQALRTSGRVQDECQRIWFSLPADEQQAVARLAAEPDNNPPTGALLERLLSKELVTEVAPYKYALFSGLFGACIVQLDLQAGVWIRIDHARHAAWVGERYIEHLPPLAFRLLDYLVQNRGKLCTREELARNLYPDELERDTTGSTDGRLDTIVTRLRKQIEPDPNNPRFVLTERGFGYRLADGTPDSS